MEKKMKKISIIALLFLMSGNLIAGPWFVRSPWTLKELEQEKTRLEGNIQEFEDEYTSFRQDVCGASKLFSLTALVTGPLALLKKLPRFFFASSVLSLVGLKGVQFMNQRSYEKRQNPLKLRVREINGSIEHMKKSISEEDICSCSRYVC